MSTRKEGYDIRFRVSPKTYAMIQAVCEDHQMTLPTLAKHVLLLAVKDIRATEDDEARRREAKAKEAWPDM